MLSGTVSHVFLDLTVSLLKNPPPQLGEVVEPVDGEDESQTRLLRYEFCLYPEKLGNGGRASSLLRTSLSPAREWG